MESPQATQTNVVMRALGDPLGIALSTDYSVLLVRMRGTSKQSYCPELRRASCEISSLKFVCDLSFGIWKLYSPWLSHRA